jgi:hypothetical protein
VFTCSSLSISIVVNEIVRLDLFMLWSAVMRMPMQLCQWSINTNIFDVNHWFWSIPCRENSSSTTLSNALIKFLLCFHLISSTTNIIRLFSSFVVNKRSFPLTKLIFDIARVPFHWPIVKLVLKMCGYQELLTYQQRDVLAALRMWLLEDTIQVTCSTNKRDYVIYFTLCILHVRFSTMR